MKATALLSGLCALAIALGLMMPTPDHGASAKPQYPTLEAGRR